MSHIEYKIDKNHMKSFCYLINTFSGAVSIMLCIEKFNKHGWCWSGCPTVLFVRVGGPSIKCELWVRLLWILWVITDNPFICREPRICKRRGILLVILWIFFSKSLFVKPNYTLIYLSTNQKQVQVSYLVFCFLPGSFSKSAPNILIDWGSG